MAEKITIHFNDDEPSVTFDRKYRKGFPKVRHEFNFTVITDELGHEIHIQSNKIKNIHVYN